MKKNHKILISIGIIIVLIIGGFQLYRVFVKQPIIAESMHQFNEGNELLANKSYLMANTAFKKVSPEDKERFALAQGKIAESGKLYVNYLLEGAKDFASKQNYLDSLSYMDSLLTFDPNSETAKTLKVKYTADKDVAAKTKAEAQQAEAIVAKGKAEAQALVDAKEQANADAKAKALAKTEGVRIGMTQQEVLDSSWGKPKSINKTTNQYGTHEQWVYSMTGYLYFDDGILTSIQN